MPISSSFGADGYLSAGNYSESSAFELLQPLGEERRRHVFRELRRPLRVPQGSMNGSKRVFPVKDKRELSFVARTVRIARRLRCVDERLSPVPQRWPRAARS